eukprot:gene19110-4953_t
MAQFVTGLEGQNQQKVPLQTQSRQWSTECCSCPMQLCCETFWCALCQMARVNGVVQGVGGTPERMDAPEWGTCCGFCLRAECALSTGQPAHQPANRSKVTLLLQGAGSVVGYILLGLVGSYLRMESVKQLHVEEGMLTACCFGFWCNPCSLAQLNQQWALEGRAPGGCCCWTEQDSQRHAQPGYAPLRH